MYTVLSHKVFFPRKEVSAKQTVEINKNHDIHHHDGGQKVSTVLQEGVVAGEVPGEVELSTQAKGDVGDHVDELVDVVQGRVLSTRQLQHQPQV